jgi:hypothetical protein
MSGIYVHQKYLINLYLSEIRNAKKALAVNSPLKSVELPIMCCTNTFAQICLKLHANFRGYKYISVEVCLTHITTLA